jgi:lipoate-protein ligase A
MTQKATKEEQIGFHKGALSTLAKEREEMMRILGIVEQLMQMHVQALKELGVDLEEAAKKVANDISQSKKKAKPIEDLIK